MRELTLKLMLALAVLSLGITSARAEVLRTVEVSAPAINCLFDPTCRVVVNDSTDTIPIGAGGSNFLQSRTFKGRPGSAGHGLYVYEYRIDLRRATGILHIPCLNSLSLDFGPVVRTLDFNGDGERGDEVFVVTRGGLGTVGLISAEKSGSRITFNLSVCAGGRPGTGQSTFFFGLVSTHAPAPTTATIVASTGKTFDVQARAPREKDPLQKEIQQDAPVTKPISFSHRGGTPKANVEAPIPHVSASSPKYSAHLVGLNVLAGAPAPKEACPPADFDANASNLLSNPSFEVAGPRGRSASFSGPDGGDDTRSAAAKWTMHTSNDLANVTTELVRSKRLGGGASMLHISAASNEGGVYQLFARDDHGPERVVASVWVYVTRGRVALGTGNEGATPNSALSTTRGKWEKLQACSDGTTTNNWFVIYSTDVEGSDFYVDLARVSKVKPIGNQCGGMLIERIVPNVTFPGGTIAINGRNFGRQQGTKVPAINRGRVDHLQVTRWTDTQILARSPLDLVGGTYRVLIYCDDTYRTSSNSLEVTVRDDIHRPR